MFFWMVLALIFAVAIFATPAGQILLYKGQLYAQGINFTARAKDLPSTFRGSNAIKMSKCGAYDHGKRKVRVVFIRHGQSVWNSIFNSFDLGWPMRAVKAIINEAVFFFTSPFDSVFIDSPLSSKGQREVEELAMFIRSAKDKVPSNPATSVVVTSNLRRAMETALVGVAPRLTITKERIMVDSSLQEGSQNIDAQTLSAERRKLAPVVMGPLRNPKQLPSVFDPSLNDGGKIIGCDVYQRMDTFLTHLFGGSPVSLTTGDSSASGNAGLKEVIVVGHSGYFRNFFRRFLPSSSNHVSKRQKMQNCAVVAFDLFRNENTGEIFVDEGSISVLYKGFK